MAAFLAMVERSYAESDEQRRLNDRVTRLASEELTESLASLRASENLFRSLTRCSPNGIIYADWDGRCVYANEKAEHLTGWTTDELLGLGWHGLVPPDDLQRILEVANDWTDDDKGLVEHRLLVRHQDAIWVSTSLAAVVDAGGKTIGWVAHIEDITERKLHERELSRLARQDSLTRLDNRHAMNQRLADLCANLDRSQFLAVALLDLDRFKLVNDSFGHEAGDQLLMHVADRLRAVSRPSDLVARLGGDEFAYAAVFDCLDGIEALGRRLSDAVHGPVEIDGRVVHVAGSVGLATSGYGRATPESLLRDADTAMYRAKRSAAFSFQIFDETFREEVTRRFAIESELRNGLTNGEFRLEYQPVVAAASRSVSSVEALARWDSINLGAVSPAEFIPVAEELGLIGELAEELLNQACRQLRAWRQTAPLAELRVSFNVSPLQLSDFRFPSFVARTLEKYDLPSRALVLEVTEGAILSDFDKTVEILDELREMGIKVAIDDFGTGYSSLSYLERLPVDYLKIDQSFVQSMGRDQANTTSNRLTETIIDLARRFGLTPVAEGVETETQREILSEAGCDLVQGFLLARPMSADDPRLLAALTSGSAALASGAETRT